MTVTSRLACVAVLAVLAGCAGDSRPAAAPPQTATAEAPAAAAASLPADGAPTAPAANAAAVPSETPAAARVASLPAPPPPPVVAAVAAPAPETAGPPPRPAAPAGQGRDAGSYVIGSGDQLNVFVYDSPQLSMTVPVRPDGRISTPLVPEMMAAGKTPNQLAQDLTERLKEYVKEPNVTVIVSGFVGPLNRQIRVIGEATEPQAIPYRDHMTVLDVMILTKGLTRFAAGNRAVILRGEGDRQERIRVRLSDLMKDGDISQNVEMRPGDTLIIPQTWF